MLSADPCCMQGLRSKLMPTQSMRRFFRKVHGTEKETAIWDTKRQWRGVRSHGYGTPAEYTAGPFLRWKLFMGAIVLVAPLPVCDRLTLSRRKDPHVRNRRAAFLCFGFGFDFLDVSQGEPDTPAKVVSLEFSRSSPSSESHRCEFPAL